MRLLAFSDLHRDRKRAERLVELAGEADVVVGAGDYATMRTGLEGMIETLSAITAPAVLVPGNAESDAELWRACAVWPSANVHGQGKEIVGAEFFGLGGGVPTPFPWSFDLSEDEAAAKLENCPEGAVLVVHVAELCQVHLRQRQAAVGDRLRARLCTRTVGVGPDRYFEDATYAMPGGAAFVAAGVAATWL